ncbi:MAG: LCP family protein [Coriobacteriaceae bacterium]|nr:LCP family protein [Coriobacteriaceae bacterium]
MSHGDYTQHIKKKKRKKTLLITLSLILVAALGLVGAALVFYQTISDNLHEGLDPDLQDVLVKTDLAKEPFYMLLMGTDGSSERTSSEEFGGDNFRSDSIMLARIDPVNKKVTLVSIHRDTLVDMGEYGQQKLNAAHAFGGASLSVQMVSKLAGVPISHYAEINFDGFSDIVNALGGVEVNVPVEIDDDDAGGYLARGTQILNGEQALVLCRSRNTYQEYGDPDSFRAANQRLVIGAIAKKLLGSDLATMASTVTALSQYVTTDLEITDIIGLAQAMRGLDSATDIYSAMEPATSAYIDEVWYMRTDTAKWKAMMTRVDQGLPPTEDDLIDDETGTVLASTGKDLSALGGVGNRSGTIAVLNGTDITGAATAAGKKLRVLGYTVDVGNADASDYPQTLVIYDDPSKAQEAQEIAEAIGRGKAQANDGTYVYVGDFLVVIGADWS